jgi:ferredoxin
MRSIPVWMIWMDDQETKHMNKKARLLPNPITPCMPVTFDPDVCIGCNTCVDVCRTDVLMPNPETGKPPLVVYPDECWFCGCCVEDCPIEGANRFHHPLNQEIAWKRKNTGELFRVGIKTSPPPCQKKVY